MRFLTRLTTKAHAVAALPGRLDDMESTLREEFDATRSLIDVDEPLFEGLEEYRSSESDESIYAQESP